MAPTQGRTEPTILDLAPTAGAWLSCCPTVGPVVRHGHLGAAVPMEQSAQDGAMCLDGGSVMGMGWGEGRTFQVVSDVLSLEDDLSSCELGMRQCLWVNRCLFWDIVLLLVQSPNVSTKARLKPVASPWSPIWVV